MAIQSAKDTIYIENQHIAHDYIIDLLIEALKRGVVVLYLVPGQGMPLFLILSFLKFIICY